jgi:probable addiction module antidote protein
MRAKVKKTKATRGVARKLEQRRAKVRTTRWDAADYLKTDRDIALYFEAVLEDGDPALIAAALGDIARTKGMARIAREAGLGRESLYKALSADGNPEFATVLKVVRALGLKLKVAA